MKRDNFIMKLGITTLVLLLSSSLLAQDLYLPATTKSKEAKELYVKAIDAFYDVEFSKGYEITDQALKADPDFFMGYFLNTFKPDKETREKALEKMVNYTGKLNKGEKIIKEIAVKSKADPKYNALEDWQKLAEKYPKNIFPKTMLINAYAADDATIDKALMTITECQNLNANLAFLENSKGYFYLQKKDYEKAKMAFDKYIELAPEKANPHDSKGDYYMAVKEYKNAAMSYKKAFDTNESFDFSKVKLKEAKWMYKRQIIADELNVTLEDWIKAYNEMDVKKSLSFYSGKPGFCTINNGKVNNSYSMFVKSYMDSTDKLEKWHVNIVEKTIDVAEKNVAVVNMIYDYSSTSKEGESVNSKGNYTSIWKKMDDRWLMVQIINTWPLKE